MDARCSRRSRPAQREWQRSSRRNDHQRLPPLRMTSIVRPNVSAATKISQFPLQRYWRGVARVQTDEKGRLRHSGRLLWVIRVDIAESAFSSAIDNTRHHPTESWGADLALLGRQDKSDDVARGRRGT